MAKDRENVDFEEKETKEGGEREQLLTKRKRKRQRRRERERGGGERLNAGPGP